MTTKKPEKINFEEALLSLEKIVEQMETNKLSLEDSLKLFERGVHLTEICQKMLTQAEQQVQQLINKNGNLELADYKKEE